MIDFITGDIFNTRAAAIGHGVNTSGVMGAGIAKIVRDFYPSVYRDYRRACTAGELQPGSMLPILGHDSRWIFNIASQDRPGPNARLEWLESGMTQAFEFCEERDIRSFAIPRIGAGIGGLDWNDVRELLVDLASIHVEVDLQVWTLPPR